MLVTPDIQRCNPGEVMRTIAIIAATALGLAGCTTIPKIAQQSAISPAEIHDAVQCEIAYAIENPSSGASAFADWVAAIQLEITLTDSIGMMMHAETLSDEGILEARLLLEVPVAGLAAQRRNDDQLKRLSDDVVRGKASEAEHRSRGRSFHLTMLEAAGNPLLDLMARPIFDVLTTRYVPRASSPAFWKKVNHEHRLIHDAVLAGDVKTAELTMHEHVRRLNSVYQKIDI